MMAEFSKSKVKLCCTVCDREFQYSSNYMIHLASINHLAMEDIIKAGSQSPDVLIAAQSLVIIVAQKLKELALN